MSVCNVLAALPSVTLQLCMMKTDSPSPSVCDTSGMASRRRQFHPETRRHPPCFKLVAAVQTRSLTLGVIDFPSRRTQVGGAWRQGEIKNKGWMNE